jgi:aryl-alcohol dehydrogenase-like predicted oxidoreductase
MKKNSLGKNGPSFTEIGIGTWAFSGPWKYGWGSQDDKQSIATLHRSIELGINWIDTAPFYGFGHSEEIVGLAITGRREDVYIATKCGLKCSNQGEIIYDCSPENIRRECEESLKRLKTDYIDLYQIHWLDPDMPVEKSWDEMVRLKESGKTRFIGVCNYDIDQLERCEAIHHINSLQSPYSMVHRDVEKEILPWCLKHEVGFLAYSPLQSGLLTGKFNREKLKSLPGDDWRVKGPVLRESRFFTEPLFSNILQFIDQLMPIAKKYEKQAGHLAIAWVIRNKPVVSALAGARNPGQIEKNTGGAGWRISSEDMQKIDLLYQNIFS